MQREINVDLVGVLLSAKLANKVGQPISYCVKDVSGKVLSEGTVPATRIQLTEWMKTLPAPWTVAMEATMFTGWIYDHLLPHAAAVKVAHPLMLRAIAAAKKKNDRIDASKICDCLRCDFLPECHMVSTEVRERRRTLRYRKLLVRQNVQLRNKVSQMLMESGVVYNKQKLHKVGYFKELMETNQDIGRALRPLLTICRETIVRIGKTESALIRSLRRDPLLQARVERLMTIPAVGPITALTWVLEVDDVARFHSVKQAVSYCGLCGVERSSAETIKRMPIYEPIPGEMVAYGLSLENSDFGNGALSVRAYPLHIWCTNLAITQEEMRQVHLGKRLDDSVLYSNQTYELDAKATVSALRDVIESQLDADSLKRRMEAIRHANVQVIDARQSRETFRRLLQKGESEAAAQAFESQDTYNLPAGNTNWRLSNAISWIAGQTMEPERKLDLMKIAGEVLPKAA